MAGHQENSGGCLGSILSFILMLVVVVGLTWGMRTFVFQPYKIPSGSMESTIMTGDLVFSEKVSYYLGEPEQGDIVTFADPEVAGRTLIKRVIATEGQTVDINDEDGMVYVDGVPLTESYTQGETYTLDGNFTYPYTVGEGELWLMGDNRENSQDSRHFGSVPASTVTGKAVFVYWPIEQVGTLE